MDKVLALRPKELSDVIGKFIKERSPILIKGEPGVGKTSIVEQTARSLNYECILSHPCIQSPTDYRGFPVYNREEDRAKFLPYETLERLVRTKRPTVFFLDDFGQALPSVQAAIQNLLSSRQVGDHKISDDVVFVIATNDKGQGANVTGVLSTIKSRCGTIVELKTDPEHWLNWAMQNNIRPEVTGFIRLRPEMLSQFELTTELTNFPCPRTVANLSKILDMEFDEAIRFSVIAGAVGQGFAVEFEGWLKLFRNMVSPDYIIQNPETAEIPENTSAKVAIISALAHRANKKNLLAIMTYGERLEPEYRIKMIEYDIMSKDDSLKETGDYAQWLVKNQQFLNE